MTILKEYNNVVFIIHCINKTNNNEYRSNSLDHIMYIYGIFLIVKSFLKEVILRKLYKLRKNIFCITNIKNTVQRERSFLLSVVIIVMSKSRIDVEVLKEYTMIVISRLRDVTSISLKTSVDIFYVFINKTRDIKKESVLRESIFEKLRYS